MADSDHGEVDLATLRKNRARHQATVLKIKNHLQSMLDEDDLASLDPYQLEDIYTSIDTSLRRCIRTNDSLVKEETDDSRQEEDETAWDLFQGVVSKSKSLCKRLMSLRGVHGMIQTLDKAIFNLANKKARDPTKDYALIVQRISVGSKELTDHLQSSTIPEDHPLQSKAIEIEERLQYLEVKDAKISSTDSKDFHTEKKKKGTFKLPQIDIPTFNGDLKNWHHYWSHFKHAVHDNETLDNRDKLAYLIKSMA